jgi:hypothetical protein
LLRQITTLEATALRTLLALLLLTLPALAADTEDFGNAREAKHTILPIVGYQFANDEDRGIDWERIFLGGSGFPDTVVVFSGSAQAKLSTKSPVLGALYRYRMNDRFQIEGSMTVIQDRTSFVYPVHTEFYGFLIRSSIKITRQNTAQVAGGACYTFDTPYPWLTGLAQFGAGYAWRDIEYSWGQGEATGIIATIDPLDASKMMTVRGGVDFSIWSDQSLLLQGGMNYTQFIPMDTDAKPFGGIGWRFSVFPLWSFDQE